MICVADIYMKIVFANTMSSYNYVKRESMASGDCLRQDMRSIVPEYAKNGECFAIFDYIYVC